MSLVVEVTDDAEPVVLREIGFDLGPGGGGSGGGTPIGGAIDIQPVLVSVGADPLSANFASGTVSLLEGESITVLVRLNRTMAEPVVVDVQLGAGTTTAAGQVRISSDRIIFQAGDREKPLTIVTTGSAGGASSTLAFVELFTTPSEAEPQAVHVEPQPTIGPITLGVTIQDEVVSGGPPRWSFGAPSGGTTVIEGVGVQTFSIQLDRPAEVVESFTVEVDVASPANTAVAGLDYVPFTAAVLIGESDSSGTFQVSFPDNFGTPPTNPVLVLRADATTTALPGAVTSLEITILDNDDGGAGSGTVRINWTQLTVPMFEGDVRTLTARLTQNGTATQFQQAITVPILRSGDTSEFSIVPSLAGPNTLFFAAGESTASVEVTSVDNETAGAMALEFDLTATPTNLQAGNVFRTTVSSNLLSLEETTLQVPAMAGSSVTRRMIQGLAAVNPPSPTLPEYRLSTGERVQVVGHTRDAEGRWIAAYFYGLAPATESIAGDGAALRLELADGSEPAPAEAGTFATPPPITIQIGGADGSGTAWERTCHTRTFPGRDGSIPTLSGEWTGTAGVWAQVGPEIVRQTSYLMRPMDPGTTQSPTMQSPQALGYVELCETLIAGDPHVVLYEGQWVNGAWASQDRADVDAFTENPFCDGNVVLRNILAQVENSIIGNSGWSLELVDLHPAQQRLTGTQSQLLRTRTEPYFFPTCQAYTFRFVATRNTGGADAVARAADYHRYKHVAWAVGGYGSTRNRIYGDTADMTVDWARAELQDLGQFGNGLGWRAIKSIGESVALGYPGQGGSIEDWTTGQVYPFSQTSQAREGWQHPLYPAGGGDAGGQGIYGSSGTVPWWGYWYTKSMELHKVTCRVRHQFRDVTNGAAPFWWQLAESVSGQFRIAVGGSFTQRTARNRHWHFASDFDLDEKLSGTATGAAALRLAPTSRLWNLPGTLDPQYARLKSFETFHETHAARERTAHCDGWWGMRSFLAFKAYEGRAASLTRSHPCVLPYGGDSGSFSPQQANFAANVAAQAQRPEWASAGIQVGATQPYPVGGYLRAWGWVMVVSSGFYAIAPDSVRANYNGELVAGSRGGGKWFEQMAEILEFIAEATGLVGREYQDGPSPNCWAESIFNVTDFTNKTGAFPDNDQDPGGQPDRPFPGTVHAPYALVFHQIFCVGGVDALRRLVLGDGTDFLRRTLEWHAAFIEGARAIGRSTGQELMPFCALPAFDPSNQNRGDYDHAQPVRSTIQDLLDGSLYWFFFALSSASSPGPTGWNEHSSKCGWTSVAPFRALGDSAYLEIPKAIYNRAGTSDAEFAAFLMRGDSSTSSSIQSDLTSTGSSTRMFPLGEKSFLVPYLAELLNRVS